MDVKISRDDRRKQKDLDEARKAGSAPAEVDEEGKCVLSATRRNVPCADRPALHAEQELIQ